jgi:protein disulfide isomerase
MRVLAALALASVLLGAAVPAARGEDKVDDPDVLVLGKENFEPVVNGEELMLVEFYAPWCGHCKQLAPEYAKAATRLKSHDPPIKLGKVDATKEGELANKYEVRGYPTLKVFRNGKESPYNGPRDADGIVEYMKKQVGPAAKPINSVADLEKVIKGSGNYWVVGLFSSSTSPLQSAFVLTANKMRDDFVFLKSSSAEVLKYFNLPADGEAVIAVKNYDDKQTRFTGSGTTEMEKFVNDNALPLVGEFTQSTAKLYQRRGLPIVKAYAKLDKNQNYFVNRIKATAQQHTGKLLFALVDADKASHELREMGLADAKTPLVLEDTKGNKFVHRGEFNAKNVQSFADDFFAGKLEKHVKSEPVPASQDGPVKVVVGKNFDEIVLDESKDVLVEFYAPWCGHCKQLAPIYDDLGRKFKGVDSVVIAKIDATANDYDRDKFSVNGFPTIYFKPAGANPKIMSYDGAREVDAFVSFIEKHAKTKFSLDKKKKKKKKSKDKKKDDAEDE